MLGLTSFLVLSLLISLPNAANSDELTEAAKAARKEVLKNFSKEELAALSDDQIHQIIEMLPQARQIVRIKSYFTTVSSEICAVRPPLYSSPLPHKGSVGSGTAQAILGDDWRITRELEGQILKQVNTIHNVLTRLSFCFSLRSLYL